MTLLLYIWANMLVFLLNLVLTMFLYLFFPLSSSLLNPTKKDPEFRSIFQHIQSAQLRRSPSELFAQHIVSIVHYIKGRV